MANHIDILPINRPAIKIDSATIARTDAELERLKEEYRQKIAETAEAKLAYETSKAALDELVEDLEDVAQETTSQSILHAVGNIDFSTVAKQGSDTNATNTAILEAIRDVAKESTLQTIEGRITAVSNAAEAYNVGKQELVTNLIAKGVQASANETLPVLADKVKNIAQQPIILSPSEVVDMYAMQQFGSLTTPNYWNLYEVLNSLLNDGRLLNYGGILLAECDRSQDSIALEGSGAGGAYVISDKENGIFKMYTADAVHVWSTEFDGKGNRWVAYCFDNEYHNFTISNSSTSPLSIFIGRKVGKIEFLVNSNLSQIVTPNGNELLQLENNGNFAHNYGCTVVLRMTTHNSTKSLIYNNSAVRQLYFEADRVESSGVIAERCTNINSAILKINHLNRKSFFYTFFSNTSNLRQLILECPDVQNGSIYVSPITNLFFKTEYCYFAGINGGNSVVTLKYMYISYYTNDKSKLVSFQWYGVQHDINIDVELQSGWCKPLDVALFNGMTAENMYNHILLRLKQDEPNCGSGVTITLGTTNIEKLEAVDEYNTKLTELEDTYGYTFA